MRCAVIGESVHKSCDNYMRSNLYVLPNAYILDIEKGFEIIQRGKRVAPEAQGES